MDTNENATLAPCSHFDRNLGAIDSMLNSDFHIDAEGSEDLGLTLAELFASLFLTITQQRLCLELREEGVREEKRRAKL